MPTADIARIADPLVPPLVPELRVPGLPAGLDLETFRTHHAAGIGAGVPYWAVAWPGGQALARWLLDHPRAVCGRAVMDLGCGSGLVAAAAMRAGAARAVALDCDPLALAAVGETMRLSGLCIEPRLGDIAAVEPEPGTVLCAGDLWYDRTTGRRATALLMRLAASGHPVLIGDPGRPGRPRRGWRALATYRMPVSTEFERARHIDVTVHAPGAASHSERALPSCAG